MSTSAAPLGCLRLGSDFLSAATKVQPPATSISEAMGQRVSWPAYYLLGHAIELALKAYLLGQGMSENTLQRKPYRHDLATILKEARRRKLGRHVALSERERKMVAMLNAIYAAKAFEYHKTGTATLPAYAELHALASKLCRGLQPYCVRLI